MTRTILLSLMMFLVPALGVPHEELLQDTLKSILVSFFVLSASFAFFWQLRKGRPTLHWHSVMVLPLTLMTYALGSVFWSHAYLASVEAIRWFIFSLLLFVGLNTFTLERVTHLAWGVHLGAVIASLWAALQFWFDWKYFAQGPNPASTFINRNFFGEYLVCTLPISVLLLSRVKDKTNVFLLTFSLGFNVVALMMTGTRSALIALVILTIAVPIILILYGKNFTSINWSIGQRIALVLLFIATVCGIGSIDCANPNLVSESGSRGAIDRALQRTESLTKSTEYTQGSFSIRAALWKSSIRMISTNPLAGVGAGAWEVEVPRYQAENSLMEADYYAHNEILQLIAEYGAIGWMFIIGLLGYLLLASKKTWSCDSPQSRKESLLRALTLSSLLALLIVSNAGFPWRMATTGALFALGLSILLASDRRMDTSAHPPTKDIHWKYWYSITALSCTAICAGIALYIIQQAIACERSIVRAVRMAQSISASDQPNSKNWDATKLKILQLINDGIIINPHYRKLTPIVADELAKWGDWKNAAWIWESVLKSRPYILSININTIRAFLHTKDFVKANYYLNAAQNYYPSNTTLKILQVASWSISGEIDLATTQTTKLLNSGIIDGELIQNAYEIGIKNNNPHLAIQALELAIKYWPEKAANAWLKMAKIYQLPEIADEAKAHAAYRSALAATPPSQKKFVLNLIPSKYKIY